MKRLILLLTVFTLGQTAFGQYAQDSIKTDKGYLHYFIKGKGKPVVLLQGGPGFSHDYMRGIADSLKNYQSILIDYQGTGRSNYNNVDSTWVSNDRVVDDIETVRKHLKIQKWTLVGHSYGGMFALLYAVRHPENTEKIITIASAGTNQRFQEHYGYNIMTRISLENKKRIEDISSGKIKTKDEVPGMGEVDKLLMQAMFFDPENIPKAIAPIPKDAMPIFFNPAFQRAYWGNPSDRTIDITKEVLELNIPVRMIESWQDPNYDGRQLLLSHQLKNSKIEFINQSGHFPWAEQPEEFFKILKDFLDNN